MAADLDSGSQSRYEQDRDLAQRERRGPDPQGPALLLRLLLPSDAHAAQPRQPLRRAARVRQHAQRGLRQAHLHADEDDPPERQLPRLEARRRPATCSQSNASATTGTGDEARLKIFTADGSWVINSRSFATAKYTHFANHDPGPARQHRPTSTSPPRSARSSTPTASTPRAGSRCRCRWPAQPSTTPSSSRSSTATATTQNGVADRRRHRRLRRAVRQRRLLPRRRPGRLQPHARLERHPRAARRLPVATRTTEDLQRSSNGWGRSPCPAGARALQGQPTFYTARLPAADRPASCAIDPLRVPPASFELNDTIKWKNWTFNLGVLVSNDTLYGQGLREDASTLSGYVAAPGNKYKMYEIPFEQDDPAARRRDLGLQRQGHHLRAATPGTTRRRARCRAPRPGTATSSGPSSTSTSTRTACCSPTDARRRPRRASCSSTT